MNPKPDSLRSPSHRGFTLIEMMMVVAILGIMASIALPNMRGFMVRARKVERTAMLSAIRRSLQENFNSNDGNFSQYMTPWFSEAYSSWNPQVTGSYAPAPWDTSNAQYGWSYLGFAPEGALRYRYYFVAVAEPTISYGYMYLSTLGDVDGDGVVANHYEEWMLQPDSTWRNCWSVNNCWSWDVPANAE